MELWHIPVFILMIPLAFMATVAVHEYGHWLGGIFSGYRTVYICLFSFVFYKDRNGKHRNARYPGMTGQCIMVPRKGKEPDPRDLVAGGPAASIVTGIISCVALFSILAAGGPVTGFSLPMPVFFGILATFNLTFGITNLIPRGTNDGANLKEVRRSEANRKAYNKVMKVYEHNVLGGLFREIPDGILEVPEGAEGSLADELREYAGVKRESLGFIKDPDSPAPFPGNTGSQAADGIVDMKTGSWELWQQCRKDSPENAGRYLGICRKHMKRDVGLGEWKTVEELILLRMAQVKETADEKDTDPTDPSRMPEPDSL